ncbi:MAG: NUDIX domain-containing protein [Clostridia bacterium]|nr:NUDIX domain-containing protein [Clostridia bacterium]
MTYNRTMTATTYVVDRKNKKILLHLHKKFSQLYPLGGHIEPHELPHEAALREVYEESGLKALLSDEKGNIIEPSSGFVLPVPAFLLHENMSSPVQNLDFVYIAYLPEDIDPDAELKPLSGESKDFYWVDRDEVNAGRTLRGAELPIPGHIKKIAAMVFERLN